jgi:hypothetical protein
MIQASKVQCHVGPPGQFPCMNFAFGVTKKEFMASFCKIFIQFPISYSLFTFSFLHFILLFLVGGSWKRRRQLPEQLGQQDEELIPIRGSSQSSSIHPFPNYSSSSPLAHSHTFPRTFPFCGRRLWAARQVLPFISIGPSRPLGRAFPHLNCPDPLDLWDIREPINSHDNLVFGFIPSKHNPNIP